MRRIPGSPYALAGGLALSVRLPPNAPDARETPPYPADIEGYSEREVRAYIEERRLRRGSWGGSSRGTASAASGPKPEHLA